MGGGIPYYFYATVWLIGIFVISVNSSSLIRIISFICAYKMRKFLSVLLIGLCFILIPIILVIIADPFRIYHFSNYIEAVVCAYLISIPLGVMTGISIGTNFRNNYEIGIKKLKKKVRDSDIIRF